MTEIYTSFGKTRIDLRSEHVSGSFTTIVDDDTTKVMIGKPAVIVTIKDLHLEIEMDAPPRDNWPEWKSVDYARNRSVVEVCTIMTVDLFAKILSGQRLSGYEEGRMGAQAEMRAAFDAMRKAMGKEVRDY